MKEKPKDQKSELALMKTDIVDLVTKRINDLVGHSKLHLPKNYSAENALMAAWLKLQSTMDKSGKPALTVCTHDSVANSLLDMIVQGLTPAKDQCYFVVYGNKLVCLRSYFGDIALLRRVYPEARVYAEPVYQDDELEYEIVCGNKMITTHKQKLENVGGLETIVAAYAVVAQGSFEPGGRTMTPHCEIMTIEQIKKAWARGENWPPRQGKMSAHTDHPEEFVKKTVIARACKRLINASDDSYLIKAVERQALLAEETKMQGLVEEEGNKNAIDIEPEGKGPAEKDASTAEEDQPKDAQEEKPSSPYARFGDFVDEHKLDPTKARRLAAERRNLKDVRNLGGEDYAAVLNDTKAFMSAYRQKYGYGGQPTFDKRAGF